MPNFLEHARTLTKEQWLWEFWERRLSEEDSYRATPFYWGFDKEIQSLSSAEEVHSFAHARHVTLYSHPNWVIHNVFFSNTHCLMPVSVYFHYEMGYDSVEEMTEDIEQEMKHTEESRKEFESHRKEWEEEYMSGWWKYEEDFIKKQKAEDAELEARLVGLDEWKAEAIRNEYNESVREEGEDRKNLVRQGMEELWAEELEACAWEYGAPISENYIIGLEATILVDEDMKFSSKVLEVFTADKFPNRELDCFGGDWGPDRGEVENRAMERRLIERCVMGHPWPHPSTIERYYERI